MFLLPLSNLRESELPRRLRGPGSRPSILLLTGFVLSYPHLNSVYSQLVYLYPVGMFYTLCLYEVFASSLFVLALKALLMEKSVKDADFHLYITLSHI